MWLHIHVHVHGRLAHIKYNSSYSALTWPMLAERYRGVFSLFTHFNLIQSKVFDDVLYSDVPLVTSALIGSGKTDIFELAIVRLLMQLGDVIKSVKIVYGTLEVSSNLLTSSLFYSLSTCPSSFLFLSFSCSHQGTM